MSAADEAADALSAVLELENAELTALRFPEAAAFLPRKAGALAALQAVASAPDGARLRRLRDAAEQNRMLLSRAILVQTRVLGVIARAARQQSCVSYGPRTASHPSGRLPAMAISARA